ncbi:hypothetical protein IGI04_039736 [Brassica rapa subsp. trilocularis]|uniref:Reverse transcriptase zinc-binding domain-containing protein n=1 Tax=Brassica rapa subsp. trilocularis TaxID=1813537 RepID=A0ABQ7KNS6_BRACM|nr:hypothetical protein IGI04_039736 [Brassica rapa subsp. trilocularis]
MAATKMFLIKWYSSSTNLKVFQIWKTSGTTYVLVVSKSSGLLGSLLTKSSGLPGSRLDFLEVIWTSWKSSDEIWDDLPVSRLEVVWKSSGLLGSLLTKSSGLLGSRLDFLKVVWISCKVVWTSCKVVWKSSGLPKSLLTKSSELPGSHLDFLKVVWTSWKSSDKVFFHIKWSPSLRLIIQSSTRRLTCKSSRIYEISKSIAKITSALTRGLPCKSSTARRLPNSLAYIRRLQAHRITNENDRPIIVSFYDSMNHKNFKIKILGFFSSLWRESERYVVFSSQEWKKKKGKSILGALRASNWLFMVVVVLMTMTIL